MTTRNDIKNIFGIKLQKLFDEYTSADNDPSKILYHYTKFETLKKILSHRNLRLSHYMKLEDKHEIMLAHKITKETIKNYMTESNHGEFWDYFYKMFSKTNIFQYYVCSLSSQYTNEYLWVNYGDRHKGICIGFNSKFINFIKKTENRLNKFIRLAKVQYDKNGFVEYINKIINKVDLILNRRFIDFNNEHYHFLTSELCLFIFSILPKLKKESYHPEDEWRIFQICYSIEFNEKLPKKGRLATPKNYDFCEINIGPKFINEIWLGKNSDKSNECHKLLKSKCYKNTRLNKL